MTEEQVFLAALDLPDAAARAAYLDEACAGDADLRRQVEELLAVHFRSGEFLNAPMVKRRENETAEANTVSVGDARGDEPDDLHFLQPPTRPDSLGRIGHYEVLQVLGRGGFGIVFRAFDDVLQRVVAVKVLAPGMAATSPARKRFLREARSSAAIRHENVVQVHQVAEEPLPYLVMEFIPGETLQQRLDRTGPLDVPEILRIGRQVAEGLAAAHAQGLIHRDVKPGNVLIESGPHGRAKLTDFGLARAADDASISQSGVVAGTPMYMAPEQARGESLDHRADVFSLGSVLYVMCTGRPPFRATSTMAVLKRVCEDTPRPIREVIPEVPEWLCRVVQKLHAKDPAARYQSAREVADVLADCERQVKEFGGLRDFSRIPGGKPPRPRRWRWAAAALVLPLLAWGVYAWVRPGPKPAENPDRAAPEDRARFQGRWRMVALERHGKQLPVGPHVFGYRAEFSGDMSVTYVDGKPWYAKFALNAGTDPKQMDALPRGLAPIRHLYQFVGDRLVVAQGGEGQARPTGFTTTPDTWFSVATYERDTGPPDDGFVSLFNGEDLTGWKTHPVCPGEWRVEDGAIVGRGSTTYLFSESGEYADFHLRVEAKINAIGDSGVFVRAPFDLRVHDTPLWFYPEGYEANIGVNTGAVGKPGDKLTATSLALVMPRAPDEWFLLEVIARGNHTQTRVNGTVTADYRDEKRRFTRGHLALQTWGIKQTFVQFRKIEIKELPPEDPVKSNVRRGWELVGKVPPDYDEAGKHFAAALASVPDHAEAHTGMGYVQAVRKNTAEAQRHAAQATLHGPGDSLVLHNVACIHAQCGQAVPKEAARYQDLAMDALRQAVARWKAAGKGPNEIQLIKTEPAFPPSMRARPDFQALIKGSDAPPDKAK